MKLSKLRAAIRTSKGNPSITINCAGKPMVLALQKAPLLAALGDVFGNVTTAETGLEFNADTGMLIGPWFTASAVTADLTQSSDDDLLGLGSNDELDDDDDLL